ncbi:MAG: hypothetical protein V8Q30_03145 [Acutalibacteraceae bacterium]
MRWLDKAAGHGNPFAQYRLGKALSHRRVCDEGCGKGAGVPDCRRQTGNPFAQYTLGKLYLLGRDVEQDREQAREWFTRSACPGQCVCPILPRPL